MSPASQGYEPLLIDCPLTAADDGETLAGDGEIVGVTRTRPPGARSTRAAGPSDPAFRVHGLRELHEGLLRHADAKSA